MTDLLLTHQITYSLQCFKSRSGEQDMQFIEDVWKGHWRSPGKKMSSRELKKSIQKQHIFFQAAKLFSGLSLILPLRCHSFPTCIYLSLGEPEDFLLPGPKLLPHSKLTTTAPAESCWHSFSWGKRTSCSSWKVGQQKPGILFKLLFN